MTINGHTVRINWTLLASIVIPTVINLIVFTVYITRLDERQAFLSERFEDMKEAVIEHVREDEATFEEFQHDMIEGLADLRLFRAEFMSRLARVEHALEQNDLYGNPPYTPSGRQ